MQTKSRRPETRFPQSGSLGAAPLAGKVQKIRGSHTSLPTLSNTRLSFIDQEFNTRKPLTPKQVKLASLLVGAVVFAVALSVWVVANRREEAGAKSPSSSRDEMHNSEQPQFAARSMAEALDLAKRALANRDIQNIPALWHTGSASAEEVDQFIRSGDARDGSPTEFVWLGSLDAGDQQLEGVQITYNHPEKRVVRLAMLTPDEMGTWKVDFDAFAKTATPGWNEIRAGGVKQAVVRVVIVRDPYYNFAYRDEKKWMSYGLVSDDIDGVFHGYCETGSPVANALEDVLADQKRAARVTLEISQRKDADLQQFEITRVLARDWVLKSGTNLLN